MWRLRLLCLALSSGVAFWTGPLRSDPLSQWAQRNPAPPTEPLNSIAYHDGLFVAVGEAGTIVTSPNGTDWTLQDSLTFVSLNGVTYGAGEFIAVGLGGTILASPDGSTWTARDSGTGENLSAITYGNGLFVVVANGGGVLGSGVLLTSPDGQHWTRRSYGAPVYLTTVAFGNGRFVAAGSSGYPDPEAVFASPDGITWTPAVLPRGSYAVAYGNGKFVSFQTGGGSFMAMTSEDGLTWTPAAFPFSTFGLRASFAKDRFIASAGSWYSSTNGLNWTQHLDGSEKRPFGMVAYGNGTFVSAGTGFVNSTDGDSWNRVPNHDQISAGQLTGPAFGKGEFVAGSCCEGLVFRSPDGVAWATHTNGATAQLTSVVFGNGIFAGIDNPGFAYGSTVFTSTDGGIWAKQAFPLRDGNVHSLSYGNGLFLAGGAYWVRNAPMLCTSADGAHWDNRTLPANTVDQIQCVAGGNGLFMAIGTTQTYPWARVLTSTDGATWTQAGGFAAAASLLYANGHFLLVSDYISNPALSTSEDGKEWKERVRGSDLMTGNVLYFGSAFNPVPYPRPSAYGNGFFAVLGYYLPRRVAVVLTSPDAVSWTTNVIRTAAPLDYLVFGNDSFLAVGADHRVFQSGAVKPPFQVSALVSAPAAYVPGRDNGMITLTRSGSRANQIDLRVHYSLSGTASNGVDYLLLTNSAVIPSGQSSVSIPIVARGSLDTAWAKSLLLTVEPGEAYSVAEPSSAAVSIVNPGPAPRFRTSAVARGSDGTVHLVIDSPAGANLQVERSSNLADWTMVTTVTNSPGTVAIDDRTAPNQFTQQYRAKAF